MFRFMLVVLDVAQTLVQFLAAAEHVSAAAAVAAEFAASAASFGDGNWPAAPRRGHPNDDNDDDQKQDPPEDEKSGIVAHFYDAA